MNDLDTLRRLNDEAAAAEALAVERELVDLEKRLGVSADHSNWSLEEKRDRIAHLRGVLVSRIDPNEDWVQRTPFTPADFRKGGKLSSRKNFFLTK